MKKFGLLAAACFVSAALSMGTAFAEADGKSEAAAVKPAAKDHPLEDGIWSGYRWAKPGTRAMQDEDFDNPGMLWAEIGESEYSKVDGAAGKSCASCHNDAAASMKGVASSYPKYYEPTKKMINLEQRINECRTKLMKAKPYKWESKELLGMAIYVAKQSQGMPQNVSVDGKAAPFFEAGKKHYYKRRGQFDMSCAHCHEAHYGEKLRANILSQGHINGFPVYRLKWQKPGSTHRRFAGCNKQVRASAFKKGSDEYTNLELYVRWRGQGLPMETPAVRN